MNSSKWQLSDDPQKMLDSLPEEISHRKLRLFACSCCRRLWHILPDDRSRCAVEYAERYADGKGSRANLSTLAEAAWEAREESAGAVEHSSGAALLVLETDIKFYIAELANLAVEAIFAGLGKVEIEEQAQADLLREILGNPFAPITPDPTWRTSTVVNLAQQMYESRDFSPMPLLADALQDDGCSQPEIIDHCRGDTSHVRGCWVVDFLLDRE